MKELKKIIEFIKPLTYFILEKDDMSVRFFTEQNGNVREQEPGLEDLDEANRLIDLLNENFNDYIFYRDTARHWVSVEIEKKIKINPTFSSD